MPAIPAKAISGVQFHPGHDAGRDAPGQSSYNANCAIGADGSFAEVRDHVRGAGSSLSNFAGSGIGSGFCESGHGSGQENAAQLRKPDHRQRAQSGCAKIGENLRRAASGPTLSHSELLFSRITRAGGQHRDHEYRQQRNKAGQSGGEHQDERHQYAHQRPAVSHGAQGSGNDRKPDGHDRGRQTPCMEETCHLSSASIA